MPNNPHCSANPQPFRLLGEEPWYGVGVHWDPATIGTRIRVRPDGAGPEPGRREISDSLANTCPRTKHGVPIDGRVNLEERVSGRRYQDGRDGNG